MCRQSGRRNLDASEPSLIDIKDWRNRSVFIGVKDVSDFYSLNFTIISYALHFGLFIDWIFITMCRPLFLIIWLLSLLHVVDVRNSFVAFTR